MSDNIVRFIFEANGKSVIRTLDQISGTSNRTRQTIRHDADENAVSFRRMGDSAHRMRGIIGGLLGTVGLGGLGLGIKDAISAGEKWQAQQAQLQVALKNTGHYSSSSMRSIMDAAEKLSTHGGFGASETLQGMTQFVRLGLNTSTVVSRVALATNIARSSGRDFTQVLRALMMAEQGRTTGLARLGVAIPRVTTAQMALKNASLGHRDALLQLEAAGVKLTAADKARLALHNQITPAMEAQARAADQQASVANVFGLLQQRYGGSTSAFSQTVQGKISNLRNTVDITSKEMSQRLLPVVAKLATAGADVLLFLLKNKLLLLGLGIAVGGVTAVLSAHAIAMEVLKAKTYFVSAVQTLMGRKSEVASTNVARLGAAAGDRGVPALDGLASAAVRASDALIIFAERAGLGGGLALAGAEGGAATGLAAAGAGKLAGRFGVKGIAGIAGKVLSKASPWLLGASLLATVANHTGLGKLLPGPLRGAAQFLGFSNGGVVPYYGPGSGDIVPSKLTPGEGVVTTRGMQLLGATGLSRLNAGMSPGGGYSGPEVLILKLGNGKELTRLVIREALNKAARGPSNMTGGSLVTGSPGLPL